MSDNRQRDSKKSRDEIFDAALDDLFGPGSGGSPDTPESSRAAAEQVAEPVSVPSPPTQQSSQYPVHPGPVPAPPRQTRSPARTLGIGCIAVIALAVFCIAALTIIGLVAGGDPQASQIPATTTGTF